MMRLTLLALMIGFLGPFFACAQHLDHVVKSSSSSSVVAISGAEHPELIPDQDALKVFLIATMEPPDASESQRQRLRAKVKTIGLTETDEMIFITAVDAFYPIWRVYQSKTEQLLQGFNSSSDGGQSTTAQMMETQRGIDNVVAATLSDLLGRLTPDGRSKLRARLAAVKAKMQIVPAPPM
jgi:hypothetical protein